MVRRVTLAQIVTKPSATDWICLKCNFQVGETVTFDESSIVTSVQSMTQGSYLDITDRFTLIVQKEQYYDYSKLVRNNQDLHLSKLLVITTDILTAMIMEISIQLTLMIKRYYWLCH